MAVLGYVRRGLGHMYDVVVVVGQCVYPREATDCAQNTITQVEWLRFGLCLGYK